MQLFVTSWTITCQLLCPWGSPAKNTGMGCHFLLQGVFLTQKLNPGLLHCRRILYRLSHQGSPTWFQATPWTSPAPPNNLCLHVGTPLRFNEIKYPGQSKHSNNIEYIYHEPKKGGGLMCRGKLSSTHHNFACDILLLRLFLKCSVQPTHSYSK